MDPQRNRSISAARTASGAAVNTLKGPDGELSCTPAIVDFEDVRNGLLYVMAVSVRNQSKTSRRIRLALDQPSITAGFTLTFDPPAATAPGLDVRAEVDFQVPEGTPDSQGEFRGTLAVTSGAARLAVPLLARRPAPDLRVPPLADFGPCVREGGAAACALELRNAGTAPAKWKVEIPESVAGVLTISPSEGVLPPARMHLDLDGDGDVEMANEVVTNEAGCRQELHLTLEPRELALGPVRALVRVAKYS